MTLVPPLYTGSGQREDSKASNSDSIRSSQTMEQMLAPIILEKAKELSGEVFEENNRLREENRQLRESCKEFALEHTDLRKENRELRAENDNLKKLNSNGMSDFQYFLDTRKFNGTDKTWLQNFWDFSLSLCEQEYNQDDFLINAKAHVVPLFVLAKTDQYLKWKFTGTYDDFVYSWNENVVSRLPLKRQKKLTLTEDGLKAAVNDKSGLGRSDVSEWGRKAQEGEFENVYERAVEIKKRVKSWNF